MSTECASERIFKIGQYLTKICMYYGTFFRTQCISSFNAHVSYSKRWFKPRLRLQHLTVFSVTKVAFKVSVLLVRPKMIVFGRTYVLLWFGPISDDFEVRRRISPKRMKIFKIGQSVCFDVDLWNLGLPTKLSEQC